MRIGFLVEGQSEYVALPELLKRCDSPHVLLTRVLVAPVSPLGTPYQIANQLMKKIPILATRNVDKVVVLIDRENCPQCAGHRASEIRIALNQRLMQKGYSLSVDVVIKNRCFENWLVADVEALREISGIFELSQATLNQIQPNKADNANAIQLLRRSCCHPHTYEKVAHSKAILSRADPNRIAANSRSFRRFLRLIDCPLYSTQSRNPIAR
ncbi:MAG: DUF4276 family protein [Dehalococcoidia bacterium]